MDRHNPAAPAKLARLERQSMALALRKQGGTYRQIAAQLAQQPGVSAKYSEAQAHRDVMAALKRLNDRQAEEAEAVQRLELERLDELWAVYYPKATTGDYAAFDRCMVLMDRRARYRGLYAPTRQEVAGPEGGPLVVRYVNDWRDQAAVSAPGAEDGARE